MIQLSNYRRYINILESVYEEVMFGDNVLYYLSNSSIRRILKLDFRKPTYESRSTKTGSQGVQGRRADGIAVLFPGL